MKSIIFLSLILFAISAINYNPSKAIDYARKHCGNYNKLYNNYRDKGCDCSNFVSQCLIAGGFDMKSCEGLDDKGAIPNTLKLKTCLTKKGWKSKKGMPNSFKPGYPFFLNDMHARIATKVNGKVVTYCDHKCTDTCDGTLSDDTLIYYYL